MTTIRQWQLRAEFARRLSGMYGREVPAYITLVDVSQEVNAAVLERSGAHAERLGSVARVTAERHGAVRVGTPAELRQVARIFAALGMHPVGLYDLREAAVSAVPVVSTAFRPIEAEELARNPFRVFTSMLTPADPRFFDDDLLLQETDRRAAASGARRDEAARTVWQEGFPCTERGLIGEGLAFSTYHLRGDRPRHGRPPASVAGLLDQGWLAGVIDCDVHDPFALYARQQTMSIAEVAKALELTGGLG